MEGIRRQTLCLIKTPIISVSDLRYDTNTALTELVYLVQEVINTNQ